MLYESDLTNLLSQWQERLGENKVEQSYKDALNDCIYDLRTLIDSNFTQEALAQESFMQKLKEDEATWNDFFQSLTADGIFD